MGRRSSLDESAIYAFVGHRLATTGSVTLQEVVDATGHAMGSLYHRFRSREGLLAHTYLDALEAFQEELVRVLEDASPGHAGDGEDAFARGARAALLTPVFCRRQPARGIVLACCRRAEFVGPGTTPALRERIDLAGRRGAGALKRFAQRTALPPITCQVAILGFPLGAVRQFLPAHPVPLSLDALVGAAYWSAVRGETAHA